MGRKCPHRVSPPLPCALWKCLTYADDQVTSLDVSYCLLRAEWGQGEKGEGEGTVDRDFADCPWPLLAET